MSEPTSEIEIFYLSESVSESMSELMSEPMSVSASEPLSESNQVQSGRSQAVKGGGRAIMDDPSKSGRSWAKVVGPIRQWIVFWVRVDRHGSKWTVVRLKVDGPDKSKDKSRRPKKVKVDGLKVSKWTVFWTMRGLSKSSKVDGLKILNSESERSGSTKMDGLKISKNENRLS